VEGMEGWNLSRGRDRRLLTQINFDKKKKKNRGGPLYDVLLLTSPEIGAVRIIRTGCPLTFLRHSTSGVINTIIIINNNINSISSKGKNILTRRKHFYRCGKSANK
jgi:hypothetical protein